MIDIEVSLQFDVRCKECGARLDAEVDDGVIVVSPCDTCREEKEKEQSE